MTQIITQNWGWWWGGWGTGDMKKSVYDTTNIAKDCFDYDNFYNTPDLSDYVDWPASSTDWNIVLFDWATGKLIKDSWAALSSKLDASALSDNNYWWAWNGDTTHTPTKNALYTKIHTMDVEIWNKAADNTVVKLSWNQTINWTKTFWTSPVVPSKSTAATNSWTAIATEAQVKLVADDVATINGMISSNASSSNKLMDKNYIDDSINSVTAYYITKNAQGDQFATYSELSAATTFYSGGVARTPTRNDYCIVAADENHDNATTRYIYNSGWEYQYTVNETALTTAQLNALNSWITSGKVSTYDGYATWKQDALTAQTAYSSQWTSTAVPTITTNSLWQVTTISETDIAFPVTSVNGNTWAVTWLQTQHTATTATLSSASWSSKAQTVSVTWVTASNTVIVSPDPTISNNFDNYTNAVIYCSWQWSWTLTFTCDTEPTSNITVNVLILN